MGWIIGMGCIIGLVCVVVLVWLWALGVIEVRWRRYGFTEIIENETNVANCSCGDAHCDIEKGQWS